MCGERAKVCLRTTEVSGKINGSGETSGASGNRFLAVGVAALVDEVICRPRVPHDLYKSSTRDEK